jgi:hypothetical protein
MTGSQPASANPLAHAGYACCKVEVGGRLTAIFPPLRFFGAIFPSGRHFK